MGTLSYLPGVNVPVEHAANVPVEPGTGAVDGRSAPAPGNSGGTPASESPAESDGAELDGAELDSWPVTSIRALSSPNWTGWKVWDSSMMRHWQKPSCAHSANAKGWDVPRLALNFAVAESTRPTLTRRSTSSTTRTNSYEPRGWPTVAHSSCNGLIGKPPSVDCPGT